MFRVEVKAPLDDEWEVRDSMLILAAGRKSNYSGACCSKEGSYRELGWLVKTFDEAMELKRRLGPCPGVTVSVRED